MKSSNDLENLAGLKLVFNKLGVLWQLHWLFWAFTASFTPLHTLVYAGFSSRAVFRVSAKLSYSAAGCCFVFRLQKWMRCQYLSTEGKQNNIFQDCQTAHLTLYIMRYCVISLTGISKVFLTRTLIWSSRWMEFTASGRVKGRQFVNIHSYALTGLCTHTI